MCMCGHGGRLALEGLTFSLPGHEGITRSGRGTNIVENANGRAEGAMSYISGVQSLTKARLWGIFTYINIKAGAQNKGDPDRHLFDVMRMKVLEDLAKLLELPRMFPEHNMTPTTTPKFLLTDSLEAPQHPPALPQLQPARTSVPPASHNKGSDTQHESLDVCTMVSIIQGVALSSTVMLLTCH